MLGEVFGAFVCIFCGSLVVFIGLGVVVLLDLIVDDVGGVFGVVTLFFVVVVVFGFFVVFFVGFGFFVVFFVVVFAVVVVTVGFAVVFLVFDFFKPKFHEIRKKVQ